MREVAAMKEAMRTRHCYERCFERGADGAERPRKAFRTEMHGTLVQAGACYDCLIEGSFYEAYTAQRYRVQFNEIESQIRNSHDLTSSRRPLHTSNGT